MLTGYDYFHNPWENDLGGLPYIFNHPRAALIFEPAARYPYLGSEFTVGAYKVLEFLA